MTKSALLAVYSLPPGNMLPNNALATFLSTERRRRLYIPWATSHPASPEFIHCLWILSFHHTIKLFVSTVFYLCFLVAISVTRDYTPRPTPVLSFILSWDGFRLSLLSNPSRHFLSVSSTPTPFLSKANWADSSFKVFSKAPKFVSVSQVSTKVCICCMPSFSMTEVLLECVPNAYHPMLMLHNFFVISITTFLWYGSAVKTYLPTP